MIIAIDFDGTCVDHIYPHIGQEAPHAIETLQTMSAIHKLILFTMRSGRALSEAEEWFRSFGIPLFGVQYNPEQAKWTSSNKCYAERYIDDAAFGCPLIHPEGFNRPCVDWKAVEREFLPGLKLLEDV